MATNAIRRAPRVPPSPDSMATRFNAHQAATWLDRWREMGGEAAAAEQSNGSLLLCIFHNHRLSPAVMTAEQLDHLCHLKQPEVARCILQQVIIESAVQGGVQ